VYVFLDRQIAASGTKAQVEYLATIKESKAEEDCLVDNWVGHARLATLAHALFQSCIQLHRV
jgi:hypothetical protein